jgi:phosphatidylinositol-3-phosphatase
MVGNSLGRPWRTSRHASQPEFHLATAGPWALSVVLALTLMPSFMGPFVAVAGAYGPNVPTWDLARDLRSNAAPGPPIKPAQAATSPCGQKVATLPQIQHVLIVMLENHSYKQVIGSTAAPYETQLAAWCANATAAYGATHTSAANYLATSAGQYPSTSVNGCNYSACASNENNLYQQLDKAGLTWKAYEESMPSPCDKSNLAPYKIGHNPPIFYTGISSTECKANDVGVSDLTAQSGTFWSDLQNESLPSLSWITPNTNNDGEDPCGGSCALSRADNWLQTFITIVTSSHSYQNGSTLVLVTYDEGTGADSKVGEDCTNKTADLAGSQPSCHIPLFVIWPYVPGSNSTFLTHYSLTRSVEDLYGMPCLAHACDSKTNSLLGHGLGF